MFFLKRYWLGFVIGISFIYLVTNEGFRRMVAQYLEIRRLKNEIVRLKKDNDIIRKEIYLLEHDSTYIENIARKELGLISPDEIEYRIKE